MGLKVRFTRRQALILPAVAALGGVVGERAMAENYPDRPVSLIVPYTPGGGTDIAARLVAPVLSDVLGQPVLVVNKPGAGSIIGIQYVEHAAPDGYTLLFAPCDGMVMDPAIYQNLPYDTIKDFVPVSDIFTYPLFLIVKGDSPFKTVQDLIAYAKANPDKTNYSSASSVFWLGSELFAQQAGIKATRVPYKGAADMVMAVLQGEVLFSLPSPPPVLGQSASNAVRILATTATTRSAQMPDVPTMAEVGLPNVTLSDWSGIWAPATTPMAIIETLNQAVHRVLAEKPLADRAGQLHLDVVGTTLDGIKEKMTLDLRRWKSVAEKANISEKL